MAGNRMTPDESLTLVIERIFDAPRELVWDAWTDEKHARRWWAPQGLEVAYLEMDIRVGGKWRKCMRSPGGSEVWRSGVFTEVTRPERLAFTYYSDDPNSDPDHETVVVVTFEEDNARTRLTLEQKIFESVAARNAHQGGWSSSLDRLGDYLLRSQ